MKKILFITNGHGEDLVAVEIIKRLKNTEIALLPLVAEGKAFEGLPVQLLGTRRKLPSGGFSLRNLRFLQSDLSAGLLGQMLNSIFLLKKLRGKYDLSVAIGDIVPIIGALLCHTPFIFVGVNKSDYYKWFGFSYTPWEKWLLKKYAKKIYVRDRLTMDNLNQQGIPAEYVGNPLMDCIGENIKISEYQKEKIRESEYQKKRWVKIGLLPGTREDAKLNLEDFERVIEELIALKDPDTNFNFLIATTLPDIPEYMERKPFTEVLAEADLIVGLSGTGNEQAAGLGVPVISFYGRGAQYNKKFALAQKQLLGEALLLIKSRDLQATGVAVWKLLHNPNKIREMGKIGKERMGEGGAVENVAKFITDFLSNGRDGQTGRRNEKTGKESKPQ